MTLNTGGSINIGGLQSPPGWHYMCSRGFQQNLHFPLLLGAQNIGIFENYAGYISDALIVYISRWWFDSHLLCPSLLGEMIQFDLVTSTRLHVLETDPPWCEVANTGAVRGGNAELAAAVPGLEVVAGHKDAVTWWCSFGDWITSNGLVVNLVHARAFFGFQTGPQTTTK